MFAGRVGFRSDDNATTAGAGGNLGDWDSKAFIGWAAAGDASILDHDTGVVTTTAGNLHGFHICELGEINGVSKRTTADAMAAGTNYTGLRGNGAVFNTLANGCDTVFQTVWYDLALRMDITDMSDDDDNGQTTFYWRRVRPGRQLGGWTRHATILQNETANHTVALVPTIEFINGPTADCDGAILIDWWAFGRNRVNR